jgi:hypothetical protein
MSERTLLQEQAMREDPTGFRLLVACCMMNRTSGKVARERVWEPFWERFPSAAALARPLGPGGTASRLPTPSEILFPLGLQGRRAATLVKLAGWWEQHRDDPRLSRLIIDQEPPGVGEYASDSWRIFVEGPSEVNVLFALNRPWWPYDKELSRWFRSVRAWAEPRPDHEDALGVGWQRQLDDPGMLLVEVPTYEELRRG